MPKRKSASANSQPESFRTFNLRTPKLQPRSVSRLKTTTSPGLTIRDVPCRIGFYDTMKCTGDLGYRDSTHGPIKLKDEYLDSDRLATRTPCLKNDLQISPAKVPAEYDAFRFYSYLSATNAPIPRSISPARQSETTKSPR